MRAITQSAQRILDRLIAGLPSGQVGAAHRFNARPAVYMAVSVERMVLGSDYSFPPADLDPVGTVRKAGFSNAEVAKILDDNARQLIPRLTA